MTSRSNSVTVCLCVWVCAFLCMCGMFEGVRSNNGHQKLNGEFKDLFYPGQVTLDLCRFPLIERPWGRASYFSYTLTRKSINSTRLMLPALLLPPARPSSRRPSVPPPALCPCCDVNEACHCYAIFLIEPFDLQLIPFISPRSLPAECFWQRKCVCVRMSVYMCVSSPSSKLPSKATTNWLPLQLFCRVILCLLLKNLYINKS